MPAGAWIWLLNAAAADDGIHYVRPSGGTYGAEDGTSYADAWNGFANIDWTASGVQPGDTLYLDGGATYAEKLTIALTATLGNVITIRGDYGGGRATINAAGQTQGIVGDGKQYITVRDIDITGNPSNAGIVFRSTSTRVAQGITIQNCHVDQSQVSGIGISISTTTASFPGYGTDNLIDNCSAYDCGQHGIFIQGPYDGGTISNCTAYDCAQSANGWNIYLGTDSLKYPGSDDAWTDNLDNTWTAPIRANIDVHTVIYSATAVQRQVLTEDAALDADYEFTHDATTVTIRLPVGVTPNSGAGASTLIVYELFQKNAVIEDCTSYEARDNDGTGVGADHYVRDAVIRRNYVYDCNGPGISTNLSSGASVYNNKVISCGETGNASINLSCTDQAAHAYHNVVDSVTGSGIICSGPTGTTQTIQNNIINGGDEGVSEGGAGAGPVNVSYNDITSTALVGSGITDAGNNITAAPSLDANYSPTNALLVGAGVAVAGVTTDYNGNTFSDPPTIGAFEMEGLLGGALWWLDRRRRAA